MSMYVCVYVEALEKWTRSTGRNAPFEANDKAQKRN